MTRARILADYVSSGDELALKAPLAGPTFTGTVAIPNVANLETAVVANTAKVTNANPTLADINALDVTELGTVTSGNLSNTNIVRPAGTMVWLDTETHTSAAGGLSGTTNWNETTAAGSNPRLDIDLAQATIDLYSAIFIEVNSTATVSAGSSFTFAEFRIARNGASFVGARQLLVGYPSNSLGTWFGAIHLMGTDQSPPSSGGAKYELQFRNHHGNLGYAGTIAPMGSETDITAAITVWGII